MVVRGVIGGGPFSSFALMMLSWRGDEAEAVAEIDAEAEQSEDLCIIHAIARAKRHEWKTGSKKPSLLLSVH